MKTNNRKIAFFDIDGTLTSEINGQIPDSTQKAISQARANGHLMFINTGRCMQNIESRFRNIGFDGYICGCGTNVYCNTDKGMKELLYIEQSHQTVQSILEHARHFELDILFESKKEVRFDTTHTFYTDGAQQQYNAFLRRNYDMSHNPEADDFTCDKFVIWFKHLKDIPNFCKVSDLTFECINRGGNFREFVPKGYSKATGIQLVLDYYNLSLTDAYAFGDSNNDLPMLSYVPNSIAMGNATPQTIFEQVSFVTTKASENGILHALEYFNFL